MPAGENQKLKMLVLMKILTEETDRVLVWLSSASSCVATAPFTEHLLCARHFIQGLHSCAQKRVWSNG